MDNESLLTLLMRPDVHVPGRENQQHYRLTFTITKTNHQLTDQLYLFCHESHPKDRKVTVLCLILVDNLQR